jgi:RNA polymerase sigma-70 factor (ECF subfamily)
LSDPAAPVQAIVEEIQAGRSVEESFRRLVDLYHRPLYRLFLRRGFAHQDCLDLTQETFLGIYRGIGSFRGESRFETWLYRVATNAWRKRLRHGAADKRAVEEVPLESGTEEDGLAPADLLPSADPLPGAELLQEERRRRLRAAIQGLPDQMRKCLILRIDRELPVRDIALLLRLSPETVKAHLFQARRRLRAELGDDFLERFHEE